MKNVEMVKGGRSKAHLSLEAERRRGSASGKTIIVASTEGNQSLPDRDEKIGLNVYKKK